MSWHDVNRSLVELGFESLASEAVSPNVESVVGALVSQLKRFHSDSSRVRLVDATLIAAACRALLVI